MLPLGIRVVLILTALLTCLPISASAAGSHLPTGIYALVPLNATTVDGKVLQNRNVTGLQIRASWSLLQPSLSSKLNFGYLDNLIDIASRNDKKVIVAVHRGVVGDGLPKGFSSSSLFSCSTGTKAPHPWKSTYKQAWIKLWTELVRRYASDPDVTGYHIGGIYSWKTIDWDLCDGTSRDRNNWIKAGYKIENIRAFALEFTRALASNTTKPFILPIAGTMSNSGVVNTGTNTRNYVMNPLFTCYGPSPKSSSDCPNARRQIGFMRTTFDDTTPDPFAGDDLGDQFGTLVDYSPHIAGQRQALTFDLDMLETMVNVSLNYDIQFMELGYQQINLSGAAKLIECYNKALIWGTPIQCAP
jgi:hypothetical protein